MKSFLKKTGVLFLIFALMFVGVFTSNNAKVFANDEETVLTHVYGSDDPEEPVPSIELIKTVNPSVAKPGDTVTYTFIVKNSGDLPLYAILLTDDMLQNELGNDAHIGVLDVGKEKTITVDYTIPDHKAGKIPNTATVEVLESDGITATATAELTVQAIKLTKTVDPIEAKPGDTVTYKFVVKNIGKCLIADVKLIDSMDSVLQNEINNKIQNDWGRCIGAQEEKAIEVKYTIPDDKAGKIPNTATVEGLYDNEIPVTDTDIAELTVIEINPKIKLTKTVEPSEAKIGQEVTYKFIVKNLGDVPLNNVEVTDPMFGANWKYPVGTLGLGDNKTHEFTHNYTIPAGTKAGKIPNTATTKGWYSEIDTDVVTDEDKAVLTIKPDNPPPHRDKDHPLIELTKEVIPNKAKAGEEVTYKFTIKNSGDVALMDVVVTDPMFGENWRYELDSLQRYEDKEFTVSYTVPEDTEAGKIKNTALIESLHKSQVISDTATAELIIYEEIIEPIPDIPEPEEIIEPIPDIPEPEPVQPTLEPVKSIPDLPFTGGMAEPELFGAGIGGLLILYSILRRKK
ncbi:DUF11 domain-containing protein [Lutibacter sp. B2]|nr:DUF11 domain-containing protein [Lutibacter sp. B2]